MISAIQMQTHRLAQKLGSLALRKDQIALSNLGDLAARAQPRQGQRGILPSAYDQVQGGRLAIEQRLQDLVNRSERRQADSRPAQAPGLCPQRRCR